MSTAPEHKFHSPEQRFFGRRKGPTLSGRKRSLLDDFLPKVTVPVSDETPEGSLDVAELFGRSVKQVWLEIGFGKGEHLAWQARQNPDIGVIGCEPYLNGVVGLLDELEADALDNVRVYADDARHVMKGLPAGSLDRIFLIHPDPWPKRRHARRRFVNRFNLDQFSRVLKPGGQLRIATDHPIYREWTALQMSNRDDFFWTARNPEDWSVKPDDWPETRYEAKALEGKATYFIYERAN